jgi:shikimate dehydrogenase
MPDQYAVIGNPVAHSKSPQIHAAFARATGEDLTYTRLPAPLDAFAATATQFATQGGKGLNVTVPFKLEAFALATTLSERARLAGAVNTLRYDGGTWFGDNTDGVGVVRDLTRNLKIGLAGRNILVLGAGGATRGIIAPLLAERPRTLVIANRTASKAQELARFFAAHGPVSASDGEILSALRFDVVINATSASLSATDDIAWPTTIFAPDAFAYDLVYADVPTPFLRWARMYGAAGAADGLGMLVEQAAESFFIWRGVRPATAPVFALLRPPA